MNANDLVPIHDAARELGTTHLRLLMLVKHGSLAGELCDGEWFLPRHAVEQFRATGGDSRADLACRATCKSSSCGCKG
ncbi:hypothetical protein GSUET_28880 [Geobacter sulfurreducens subsp. ethanolicus]|uniref:hypothetical protein n=1 Tax=Geobacter sulfurreducens TaxID=35554 RepID=UPI002572DA95|nr:hypothetical protein [Geobacter sulfurreducens]BEH11276.1 hypothetical protein GSUET_28880 [Geobacter sulfurreducens subsp. ethanolicus]